jgi:hypothetical protein
LDLWPDAQTAQREAERIITILSGSARLSLGSTESLHVGDVVECIEDADADAGAGPPDVPRHRLVRQNEFTVIDGPGDRYAWSQQSTLSKSVREALLNPAMEEALRLRNTGSLNWAELLRIYALIEKATGGKLAVAAFCGVTDAAITRFQQSADSVAVAERPGPNGHEHPEELPMALTDARSFVDRLLMAWLGASTRRYTARRATR